MHSLSLTLFSAVQPWEGQQKSDIWSALTSAAVEDRYWFVQSAVDVLF